MSLRARGNKLKLCQRKFRLDIRRSSFLKRAVKTCSRLPSKMIEAASLKRFKKGVGVVLRYMV